MNDSRRLLVFVLLCVAALAGIWFFSSARSKTSAAAKPTDTAAASDQPLSAPVPAPADASKAAQGSGTSPVMPSNRTPAALLSAIEATLADLRSGDPQKMKAALDRLDALLSGDGHDAAASIAAIMEFLKSGKDAPTGEEFVVGESGMLDSANSLRVNLLDHLGTLCRETGSKEALNVARDVLSKFGSADEWAVCLRNTAWLDPKSTSTLHGKLEQMLDHKPWQEKPSTGMLEAFDVAAYSGAVQLIPRLSNFLSQGEQSPLWRASTVALDQLATTHPGEVLEWLARNPTMMNEHPYQRADLIAKGDLNNPAQRRAIESILARRDLSVEERGKILAGLVTPGNFVSNNLLTTPPKFTPESEGQRLALVNRVGVEWRDSGKFPDLVPLVNDLITRSTPPK